MAKTILPYAPEFRRRCVEVGECWSFTEGFGRGSLNAMRSRSKTGLLKRRVTRSTATAPDDPRSVRNQPITTCRTANCKTRAEDPVKGGGPVRSGDDTILEVSGSGAIIQAS